MVAPGYCIRATIDERDVVGTPPYTSDFDLVPFFYIDSRMVCPKVRYVRGVPLPLH